MSKTDEKEYGTGDNPNPADEVARIPRKDDWQAAFLTRRTDRLEHEPWYPKAVAAPATQIPPRFAAFDADRSSLSVSVQPQKWDCYTVNVPVSTSNPIELWNALPGRDVITVENTGTVDFLICPTVEKGLNSIGVTVKANGGTFSINTQAAGWVISTGAAGLALVTTAWFEAPSSHLPPKKDAD